MAKYMQNKNEGQVPSALYKVYTTITAYEYIHSVPTVQPEQCHRRPSRVAPHDEQGASSEWLGKCRWYSSIEVACLALLDEKETRNRAR